MGTRVLYLVRHGQHVLDDNHERAGWLTALGRKQAERTGKRLGALPISKIYHSDLPRAAQTADIISQYLPDVPMQSTRLLREVTMPVIKEYRSYMGKGRIDYSEAIRQTEALTARFFKPTRGKETAVILLVAHGNLIRYLTRQVLGDKTERWVQLGTSNCGLTVLSIGSTPAETYLYRFNDVGHLPAKLQT